MDGTVRSKTETYLNVDLNLLMVWRTSSITLILWEPMIWNVTQARALVSWYTACREICDKNLAALLKFLDDNKKTVEDQMLVEKDADDPMWFLHHSSPLTSVSKRMLQLKRTSTMPQQLQHLRRRQLMTYTWMTMETKYPLPTS